MKSNEEPLAHVKRAHTELVADKVLHLPRSMVFFAIVGPSVGPTMGPTDPQTHGGKQTNSELLSMDLKTLFDCSRSFHAHSFRVVSLKIKNF